MIEGSKGVREGREGVRERRGEEERELNCGREIEDREWEGGL